MLIKVMDPAVIESHVVVDVDEIISINIGDDRGWITTKTTEHNNKISMNTHVVSVEEARRVIEVLQERDRKNDARKKHSLASGSM